MSAFVEEYIKKTSDFRGFGRKKQYVRSEI